MYHSSISEWPNLVGKSSSQCDKMIKWNGDFAAFIACCNYGNYKMKPVTFYSKLFTSSHLELRVPLANAINDKMILQRSGGADQNSWKFRIYPSCKYEFNERMIFARWNLIIHGVNVPVKKFCCTDKCKHLCEWTH